MTELPQWLLIATARRQGEHPAIPDPSTDASVACPRSGEIRTVRPMDAEPATRRLVLVLDSDAEAGFATVALLTDEVDLATPDDILLPRGVTGVPFDLLLEVDLVAPLWWAQLGSTLGHVEVDRVRSDSRFRQGLPLRRRDDIRWSFRERELETLQALAADCARTLVDGPADAFVPHVDPELVATLLLEGDPRIGRLLDEESKPCFAPLPTRAALRLVEQTRESELDPDIVSLLLGALHGSLSVEAPVTLGDSVAHVSWLPPRRGEGPQLLDDVVEVAEQLGNRSVRLFTTSQFWAADERPDYCMAKTSRGLVQVLPEEFE